MATASNEPVDRPKMGIGAFRVSASDVVNLTVGKLLVVFSLLALGLFLPARAAGQGSCFLKNGGCTPPEAPQQCFPIASGPIVWKDPSPENRGIQERRDIQSPSTTCHGPVGGVPPGCCTSNHPPTSGAAPKVTLRTVGQRIFVDYDAPNYYCQNTGDWPPLYTCTNTPCCGTTTDRLRLTGPGVDLSAFIYYESATWDTGIDIPCGQSLQYTVRIAYLGEPILPQPPFGIISATATKTLTAICKDREGCGLGSSSGGAGSGSGGPGWGGPPITAGLPINLGSGDVAVPQPLFAIAQESMSLPFTLTYHSSAPMFPSLVSAPVGIGWTHEYAQTLRPEDVTNDRLYHITADGREHEFLRIAPDTFWIAINPVDLRGTITQVGSEYQLTDLNGTVTSFDVATGHWNSTRDRWANTVSGSYPSGQLTTITDSMGRQVQLAYAAGQVTITLPNAKTWRLTLGANNTLTQVFDPLHTGATPWRTYAYQIDHTGSLTLLTSVRDEANAELEAHTYEATTDRGLSSSQAGATRSIVTVAYNDAANTRTVTHTIDGATQQTTTVNVVYLRGRWLPTQVSGNCATCGSSNSDLQIFAYDYSNHIIDRKDGSGAEQVETQYTYDGNGMPLSRTEAFGKPEQRTTTYAYAYVPPVGSGLAAWPAFLTKITESSAAKPSASKTKTFTWNTTGTAETALTVAEAGFLNSTVAETHTTTSTFDVPRRRLLAVTGPAANQRTEYSYFADALTNDGGRRQSIKLYTSATAHLDTTLSGYDLYGTVGTIRDANLVQTTKVTDDRGRVTTSTSVAVAGDPNESNDYTTSYVFDPRDRLTDVTMPQVNKLHYNYEDGTNRLLDTVRVDTSGNQQERLHLTLNVIGDKVTEEAQSCDAPAGSCGHWTTKRTESFSYDSRNRLTSVVHPDGSHVDYAYDSRGNLISVQDERHTLPNTPNTTYAYDFLNRLKTVTQKQLLTAGPDVTTGYTYDVQDNLTSVTDPNLNVTTYAYDDFRRMQSQTSPVSSVTIYSYDLAGNLTSTTDANNVQTVRGFDAASRILSAVSGTGGAQESVTWSYDSAASGSYGLSRLASLTDPSGTTSYAYERRGLLRTESRTIQTDGPYSLGYSHDKNGNRAVITYPSGRAVKYTFDFADRPVRACSGGTDSICTGGTTYVSAAAYEPFGPEKSLSFGNGTTGTMSHDNRYQPNENKLVKDSPLTTLADYRYSEDALGNITSICAAQPCTTPSAPYDRVFGYDDLNRLTTANSGSSLWGTGSYSYDSMGNTTSLALGVRSVNFAYVQNGGHQTPKLATASDHTPTAVVYDPAGNETAVGGVPYTYSTRNFLASGDGLSYVYDGRGLRTVVNTNISGPAPTVSGINPTSGPAAGGTPVTITGTNFQAGATVSLGGVAATGVTVTPPNSITATTGAHAAGAVNVVVTNPDTQSGTLTNGFTYTSTAPTVSSINPTSGTTAGGTPVTITGTNFQAGATVSLGGVAATGVTVTPPNSITATTGAHAAGAVNVVVTNPDTQSGTLTNGFTYVTPPPAPTVTSINPTSGTTAGGTPVTITGTNFQAGATVSLGGVAATGVTVTPPNSISATTGAHAAGLVNVVVTNPDTQSGTLTNGFTYVTPPPAPTVTSINPTSGTTAGGTPVTITGTNFQAGATVSLGGVAATGVTVTPPNSITATTGAHAAGGVDVVVTNPDTQSGTLTNGFTYAAPPPLPTITSFSPTSGVTGILVTINGTNFTGTTSVTFNGVSATSFTVVTTIKITATVPTTATTGKIAVTTPGGTATSAGTFTVKANITSFSPASGDVGIPVTITGSGFFGVTSVKFNGTTSTFNTDSVTQITATVPANATTGKITVTTAAGTATSLTDFTVAPRITSFTPATGAVGNTVTITGANLANATSVKFNGTSATITSDVATQIKATVPAGATTGPISVTTAAGTAVSATNFTVNFTPTITTFSPASGAVGVPVTINGTNFTGTTSVKFNGTAASFTVNSDIQISTTVPANATTGKITVTTPGGIATSTTDFTVAPRISSFSPTSGVIGSSVTINGANFTGTTLVTFNGTSAGFTVNTDIKITATVPAGATTGKIAVTTPAGTATSTGNFTVKPNIISFNPTSGAVGASVTITGTAFSGATSVKFNGTAATFTVNTSTQITTSVPANATTGTLSVTTPGGTATSATSFTVAPRITSFTPTSGAVGASVTINGANFTGATSVKFNGTSATFTVNTTIKITATVPAGAATGKISVTTPAGIATSTGDFTVTGSLAVASRSAKILDSVDDASERASAAAGVNSGAEPARRDGMGLMQTSDIESRHPVEKVASLGFTSSGPGTPAIGFTFSNVGLFNVGRPVSADSGLFPRITQDADPRLEETSGGGTALMAVKPQSVATVGRRYSFYSPEMNLLAETEIKADAGTPAVLYEYIWFNGHPVAQVDAGATTHWTFTDHLGTPLIQTNTAGSVYWRAEHEPFGKVFALRTANQHQPLRLPGQESEELNVSTDGNGTTERSYNIFRWYRPSWGRYTQVDPIGLAGGISLYSYVNGNPMSYSDPEGLMTRPAPGTKKECDKLAANIIGILGHGEKHDAAGKGQRENCAQLAHFYPRFKAKQCERFWPSIPRQAKDFIDKNCGECSPAAEQPHGKPVPWWVPILNFPDLFFEPFPMIEPIPFPVPVIP